MILQVSSWLQIAWGQPRSRPFNTGRVQHDSTVTCLGTAARARSKGVNNQGLAMVAVGLAYLFDLFDLFELFELFGTYAYNHFPRHSGHKEPAKFCRMILHCVHKWQVLENVHLSSIRPQVVFTKFCLRPKLCGEEDCRSCGSCGSIVFRAGSTASRQDFCQDGWKPKSGDALPGNSRCGSYTWIALDCFVLLYLANGCNLCPFLFFASSFVLFVVLFLVALVHCIWLPGWSAATRFNAQSLTRHELIVMPQCGGMMYAERD